MRQRRENIICKMCLLVGWLLFTQAATAAPDLDTLCNKLDEAIRLSPQYVKEREARIATIKLKLQTAKSQEDRYRRNLELFEEYRAYKNDSAIVYLSACITTARQMGNAAMENKAKALLSFQHSTTGDYGDAYGILSTVDTTKMDREGYFHYLWARQHLYSELAYYCKSPTLQAHYDGMVREARNHILQELPHQDDRWLQMMELECRGKKDFKRALEYNDMRMAKVKMESHEYAIVAYYRAVIYKSMHDDSSALYYFLRSALCDVRLAVMDQGSMWELANLLQNDPKEFRHSHTFIKFAWDAARTFNTDMRSRQIMPVLSAIEETYQTELTQTNKRLKMMIAVAVLLLVTVMGLLLFVNKQRRHLASAHQKLEQSNRMKEVYIGRFLRLCATYADKIERMKKRVAKLVKTRELNKLTDMMQSDSETLDELYGYFDSAFLKLFPDFVEAFNALLKPEERIALEDHTQLTTPIRIFALIRLGIEDSGKIAEFLHYSVNTIYNYRAKVKNAALCDREEFEERVKQIGMK